MATLSVLKFPTADGAQQMEGTLLDCKSSTSSKCRTRRL